MASPGGRLTQKAGPTLPVSRLLSKSCSSNNQLLGGRASLIRFNGCMDAVLSRAMGCTQRCAHQVAQCVWVLNGGRYRTGEVIRAPAAQGNAQLDGDCIPPRLCGSDRACQLARVRPGQFSSDAHTIPPGTPEG